MQPDYDDLLRTYNFDGVTCHLCGYKQGHYKVESPDGTQQIVQLGAPDLASILLALSDKVVACLDRQGWHSSFVCVSTARQVGIVVDAKH